MPSIQGKQKAEIKLISDIPISMTSNGELIDKEILFSLSSLGGASVIAD